VGEACGEDEKNKKDEPGECPRPAFTLSPGRRRSVSR
jgi:hypothetical protein